MGERCVVGVDSGGSHTRALCVGLDGTVLGRATTGGGSPTHNADAREHIRTAIEGALARAGSCAGDTVGLVAGIAGCEDESDRSWAEEFVGIEGLACPPHVMNDAIVAHSGAFAGGPGVMVVAGTGSMVLAVTETGEQIRNDRYHHYAGGARHLVFNALIRILIDEDTDADAAFLRDIYGHWSVPGKSELREAIAQLESSDYNEVKRFYGAMARMVTGHADSSPLAAESCWWLVRATSVGVRLLAANFSAGRVHVALEGGVATCRAFTDRIGPELAESTAGRIQVQQPILEPVAGAALMALQRAEIDVDDAVIARLAAQSRPVTDVAI